MIIAGVAADAKQNGLDSNAAPEVYLPFADDVQNNVGIVIRSAADESLMATLIGEQVGAGPAISPRQISVPRPNCSPARRSRSASARRRLRALP